MIRFSFLLVFMTFLLLSGCAKSGCPATEAYAKEQEGGGKGKKASKPIPLFGKDTKYKKKK